jgi:hypothetical protein
VQVGYRYNFLSTHFLFSIVNGCLSNAFKKTNSFEICGGFARLRDTLLLITRDHPVQMKMSNLKDGGWSSCRRCI